MTVIFNFIRGAMIGLAELVPGVSGGTIALITGLYERILRQANLTFGALRTFVKNPKAGWPEIKKLDWLLLAPLFLGMGFIVVTMAGVMENFVTNHSIAARSLFFGMVLTSLIVPFNMIDRVDLRKKLPVALAAFAVAACAIFFFTGFTSAPKPNPDLIWVFLAAAVAICALALPGVSGSFFLLAVGIYGATMNAISERNLLYIAVFAAGALVGLSLFVRALEHLLNTQRTLTLAVMMGFMVGSLRALWPWQDSDANLLAPGEQLGLAIGLVLLGAAVVGLLVFVEHKFQPATEDAAN